MTLFRILIVLAVALAVLLGVVALRAETTRVQYLTSKLDQEAEQSLEQLRQHELELARLRNPMIIRERARALVWPGAIAPAAADAGKPPPPATAGAAAKPTARKTDSKPAAGSGRTNGGAARADGSKPKSSAKNTNQRSGTKPGAKPSKRTE